MKTNNKQQHGFTVMQMVITIAIVAIVSTFGVLGIRNARAEFRLQSSARLFASYVEKARADSVRRHATSGSESSVETFGAGTNSYAITMDFGSGTVETRTFQLDPGIDFLTDPLKVTFDWRGRLLVQCPVTKSCVFQIRSLALGKAIPVDVSGSGDITVDEQHFPDQSISPVEISSVGDNDVDPEPLGTPAIEGTPSPDPTDSIDPIDPIDPSPTPTPTAEPTATPHGNGNGNGNGGDGNPGNGNPNASPTPTPSATATPTPSPSAQCVATLSPSTLNLSQSLSNTTGSATFTVSAGSGVRFITAAQDGNGNSLVVEKSLSRIDGSGSSVISITTKNGSGNRGTFSVKVATEPSCGSTQTLTVIVSN